MPEPGSRSAAARAAALAALTLLAACGGPEPIALQSPPQPPPGIEGRYRGTARLIRAEDRSCPRSGPRVLTLVGDDISLAYSGPGRSRVSLTAVIQPDGIFRATDGEGTLQGQVQNGVLEISILSEECEHRWTLRKIG